LKWLKLEVVTAGEMTVVVVDMVAGVTTEADVVVDPAHVTVAEHLTGATATTFAAVAEAVVVVEEETDDKRRDLTEQNMLF